MRKLTAVALVVLFAVASLSGSSFSMRRELRRMVGYTIVATSTLRALEMEGGSQYAILIDGSVFRLPPASTMALPMSDVVIFAKRPQGSPVVLCKLLIDDDIVDAVQVK
jgi:hypothetical protein